MDIPLSYRFYGWYSISKAEKLSGYDNGERICITKIMMFVKTIIRPQMMGSGHGVLRAIWLKNER